jgi:hypothetical protein
MAFKIALTPTYKTKIVVELPNEHGKIDKSDFMAEFKRTDVEKLEELRKTPNQKEVMEEVLVGWSGLLDESNQDVPFNPVNRDMLFRIPQALAATVDGFWGSIFKAREKN